MISDIQGRFYTAAAGENYKGTDSGNESHKGQISLASEAPARVCWNFFVGLTARCDQDMSAPWRRAPFLPFRASQIIYHTWQEFSRTMG